MILTNRYDYPEAIVKATQNEIYRPKSDVYRCTEILDSPYVKQLMIKYWDDIEIDVDDYIYSSLFGTAWHKFLSQWEVDAMVERRWNLRVLGVLLTGQTDIYKPSLGHIEDNKTCGAFSFVFGQPHWEEQLNVYATLVEQNGFPVKALYIDAFIRDWSKYEAERRDRRDSYPNRKFYKTKVKLWSSEKREAFINTRLQLHLKPEGYVCSTFAEAGTLNERWEKPTTYAVMKKGQKKAIGATLSVKGKRVPFTTIAMAEKFIETKKPKGNIYIDERKGECTRCKYYCNARSVCPIAKELVKGK